MRKLVLAAPAVLALAAPVGVGAQVPDYANPPGNQTVSTAPEGEALALALGLKVVNTIRVKCAGQELSSGLTPEETCFLADGLRDAYRYAR